MKKIIKNVLIVLYAIIAIGVTICLLSYNDFRVTEIGDKSLIIIDSDEYEPDLKKGSLVVVEKSNKLAVGDEVYFYNTYAKEVSISKAKIIEEEIITATEKTYTLEGDVTLSSEYVIGKSEGTAQIQYLGSVLNVLESKWGFLFLIVLPSLLAFLYEIWEFIEELKNNSKNKE